MKTKVLLMLFFTSFLIVFANLVKAQLNVALNKPTTVSSTHNATLVGSKAVDGDNSSNASRWVSKNTTPPHWIEIDLQGNYDIYEIKFWTGFNGYNKPLADFQFQRWDGSNWVDIFNEVGNSNSVYVKSFTAVATEKIRLYITKGRDDNRARIYELEVYALDEIPLPPSELSTTDITGASIDLSWQDNSSSETGFYLERSEDGVNFTRIADLGANTTTYQDTGLSISTAYTYQIQAYNSLGSSSYSNQVTIGARPEAPSDLKIVTTTSNVVTITWVDNSTNEFGFYIERSEEEGSFERIDVTGANLTTYTDENVAASTTYDYRVKAHATGNVSSDATNEVTTTTLSKETVPEAPGDLEVSTITSNQVDITWTDNSSNELGFYIERLELGGNFVQIAFVDANVSMYSDTEVASNTSYTYRIRAYNSGGISEYSNTTDGTTPESVPDAPGSLTTVIISDIQVNLFWTDNSVNELGFQIERSEDGGTTFIEIAQVESDIVSYSDKDLDPAKIYMYRIRAYNTIGESSYSNQRSATTKDKLPEAPTDLIISLSGGKIILSWTDNSVNENAFYIERAIEGADFEQFDVVEFNINTYTDVSISSDLTYTYRILAHNQAGNSVPSNEVSISLQDKDILTSLEEFLGGTFKMYPNPFHSDFHIKYTLTKPSDIDIIVYTVTGDKVVELMDDSQVPGEHSIAWDGKGDGGNQLPIGTYLCKITVNKMSTTQRVVIK